MSTKSFGERIADVLIEDGLLLPSQLEEAMEQQRQQGGRLVKILTDKQLVTEQDMIISMGRCLDTPPINLPKVRIPEHIQDLVPKEMCRAYKLCPIGKLGNKLFVAMSDPLNVLALDDLRQRTKLEIVAMIATERAVHDALSGVSSAGNAMQQVIQEAEQQSDAAVEEVKENRQEIDLDRLAVESEDLAQLMGKTLDVVAAALLAEPPEVAQVLTDLRRCHAEYLAQLLRADDVSAAGFEGGAVYDGSWKDWAKDESLPIE